VRLELLVSVDRVGHRVPLVEAVPSRGDGRGRSSSRWRRNWG
jgi:hypothetical protein